MFTNQQVDRLERDLRGADARVKARTLRRITRLRPKARATLLAVQNTAYSPRLLGALFALEEGTALDAQSLEGVAVEALARALGGRDVAHRKMARIALVHGNVSLAPAQPILQRLALDRRAAVRAAVGDLFIWGSRLETTDLALVERMLGDPHLRIVGATTAAHLLQRLLTAVTAAIAMPAAKSISQTLPPITRGHHVNALMNGLSALPGLGSGLVSALAQRDQGVRRAAVRGLEQLGAATAKIGAPLFRAIGDRDTRVSGGAFMAIRALNRVVDVDRAALRRMLRSKQPHVRANSVRAIPFVRTTPPIGWDHFMSALDDPAVEVQAAAAETLRRRFGQVPPELLERLCRVAASPSVTLIRMNAAHSVAHLAPDPKAVAAAVTSLIAGLRAPEAQVRMIASEGISCLGERVISALPDLLLLAKSDSDFNVRARALWAFREMGPRARAAAQLLEELLHDPSEDIRRFAGQALAAVRAKPGAA